MTVRVLVVDDSGFFRRRLSEIINGDPFMEVVASAADGREGLQQIAAHKPDVVTMDVEMPVMDGITAVRRIMTTHPTPILMLSHFTREGARATLDALDAGALDFLPKRMEEISGNHQESIRLIRKRIRALGLNGRMPAPTATVLTGLASPAPRNPSAYAIEPYSSEPQSIEPQCIEQGRTRFCPEDFKLLAIAASTGGPVALQKILTRLPENFPLPILLIQHMPGSFTSAYAQRLDQQCAIQVKEAEHGDILRAGSAYLAPGGRQVELRSRGEHVCIHLVEAKPDEHYKPSVDIAFRSAAGVFPAETMAIVLTGMGADGCEGARLLKQGGSTIWAQDKASSVIYGMPRAVAKAGLVDQVLSLDDIGGALSLAC